VEEKVTYLGKGFRITRKKGIEKEKVIDIVLPDSYRKGHFWCFGTTRSGKTRLMEAMISQDIRKGYSVVVIDPKGDIDLFAKIVQVALEEGRIEDLIFINPVFPDYSAVLDPLAYYYMIEELVAHIVSGVPVGKEKFFYNVAYEISLVVVQALLLLKRVRGERTVLNFTEVKNYIGRENIEELRNQISELLESRPEGVDLEEVSQLLKDIDKILSSPQDYYSKVSSSLRVALTELTSGHIGKIIGKTDENRFIKRLESGERVILVAQLVSLLTQQAAYTLGKVLISMVNSFVGRVFSSGRLVEPPLCVYIDEAQNLLYLGIEDLFAKAGGAGVWVHGFSQSVNQIYAQVGKDFGNSILDNTNTKIYMRVPDAETAEYAAKHFGKVKRTVPLLSLGGGVTAKADEDYVVRPEDVLSLQPRKFYMMSYHGWFYGKTIDVERAFVEIKFPEIKTVE
jgi:hypothetical protein